RGHRLVTWPFGRQVVACRLSRTMEQSLKPLATPFLNDGTIRALVARSERLVRALLISLFATTYWFSESCLTPSPPPPAATGPGTGEMPMLGGAAALLSMYSLTPLLSISTRSFSTA